MPHRARITCLTRRGLRVHLRRMSDLASGDQPFDERKALAELERLRNEIIRYRSKRKAAEEQFERFTASFKKPIPPVPPSVAFPTVPAALDPVVVEGSGEPSVDGNAVAELLVPTPAPVSRPIRRASTVARFMIAGAVLLVTGASYVLWTRPTARPSTTSIARGPDTPPAHEKVTTPAPAAQPARDESVVTTTRTVWLRVIADGVPVVERELPANTRLPFIARERIVIRTGNAGAVRLTIGGLDQGTLGGFGEVVTRRFDVPR
jgi:hypothetical protein